MCCWVCGVGWAGFGRWLEAWVEMFCDGEGGLEDPCLDGLQADVRGVVGGGGFVGFFQGDGEFAADGHPFCGFEVRVLEEEEEGGGA